MNNLMLRFAYQKCIFLLSRGTESHHIYLYRLKHEYIYIKRWKVQVWDQFWLTDSILENQFCSDLLFNQKILSKIQARRLHLNFEIDKQALLEIFTSPIYIRKILR